MSIFKKINEQQKTQVKLPTNPLELYSRLKKNDRYSYLRGIQEEALTDWNNRRKDEYTLTKMNTGAGKTLVGLLMLYSKMIETRERSLYLCPDKQLVNQVIEQSRHYNIPTCFMADGDSDFPEDFLNKKSILITTVQKLFNGKNTFDKDRIAVGSILFDDAHKCVEKVFDQYTIRINKNLAAYSELLTLFEEEIKKQEPGSYEGILSGGLDYFIKLPFWSWNNKREEVINILRSYIADPDVLLFKWDLFINDYSKYELYFDSHHIEISPIKCNTKRIQTYYKAKYKFAMSATFENDISLLYNLDFSLESVLNPIEPKNRNDFGQRLILAPKRYFNDFDDDSLKDIIKHHLENEQNILVIVPNYKDAELWEHHGAKKITHNIEEELENLKKSKGNFIVITNRYDGIDLSGNICNVLILHNHPNHKFLTDKYSETMLYTKHSNIIAQTIEQGMGRTVRSGNDFSVVYLLGRNILKFLRQRENFKYLNKHTRKQIEIGIDLLSSDEEIDKENIPKIICETANSCLDQDQDWLDFYQAQMDSIDESEDDENKEKRYKIKNLEKLAMIEFLEDDYEKASSIIEEILKEDISDNEKTTYYLLLANITFFIEKNTSNDLLVKARKISHLSFQPFLSKDYLKSSINSKEQIAGALEYLNSFTTLNDAINSIRETINNLQYSPHNKADKFEEAVKELGLILGYSSTRPEKDKKEGPDNLWIMDNNQCLVIEAKSEKKSSNLISKEDVSQLYHSLSWFDEKYIYKDANIYGITMQYNSKKEKSVTASGRLKVIDNESLESIKVSLNKLIDYLSRKKDIKNINLKDLNTEFKNCNLLTNELGRYLKVIK